jgi:hypothetical protein
VECHFQTVALRALEIVLQRVERMLSEHGDYAEEQKKQAKPPGLGACIIISAARTAHREKSE